MLHPVDIFVGARLKHFRKLKSLTQSQLAGEMGLTFQQIQKYEKGTNRISASRLHDASRILGIEVRHFFDGYDDGNGNKSDENNMSYARKLVTGDKAAYRGG